MTATKGSIETLTRLKELGYRIAIITNGLKEEQEDKVEAIGVRGLVDRVITSEAVGCCKPNRRIFEYVLKELGVAPSRGLYMVADSAKEDMMGALSVGLIAALYSPTRVGV
jgi:HAD superfamily hydrolase (TIGR01549 family)